MPVVTHGGVSILNAIPLGLGSSCAVDINVEVDASFGKQQPGSALLDTITKFFGERSGREVSVIVKSDLPQGGGLKSSSAVAAGAVSALSSLTGLDVDIPVLAAKLSIEAGVSITGALDDVAASLYGGISICDNTNMRILRKIPFPEGYVFVLLPRGPRREFNPELLRKRWPAFKSISNLLHSGNYIEAMSRNGLTVSQALGYETDVLLKAMELGARASGVSGNGPSLFALVKEGDEGPAMELFSKLGTPIVRRPV